MDSFSDKLKTVLNDPESMAKIAELAKNFAGGKSAPLTPSENISNEPMESPPPVGTAPPVGETSRLAGAFDLIRSPAIAEALQMLQNGSRERVALLQAMRPFVRDEKKEKLDKIIQTMKTLDLISSAQKLI